MSNNANNFRPHQKDEIVGINFIDELVTQTSEQSMTRNIENGVSIGIISSSN